MLILPAMGIVAEVIANNTRKPLWGYTRDGLLVIFLGFMSFVVWAHHMFITGMGTAIAAFFQTTTMIISIPSVVILAALFLSLWGGSIRFTTPMLFALAFLPMFGIGGLTGLPLGSPPSDIHLHDTYYVIGHFHYVVAPGTIFAFFAGIYYWFPKATGRKMNETLGKIHFWLLVHLHERDLHADVLDRARGRVAPALRRRRQLRARAGRPLLNVVSSWCGLDPGRSRSSFHLQLLLEHAQRREGRPQPLARRPRSSGRRPRRRRTATSSTSRRLPRPVRLQPARATPATSARKRRRPERHEQS